MSDHDKTMAVNTKLQQIAGIDCHDIKKQTYKPVSKKNTIVISVYLEDLFAGLVWFS